MLQNILYVASLLAVLAIGIAGTYELIAFGTGKFPTITALLRPVLVAQEPWSYAIPALMLLGVIFFFIHFYVEM
jgi:hypothetical protein